MNKSRLAFLLLLLSHVCLRAQTYNEMLKKQLESILVEDQRYSSFSMLYWIL